MKTLRTLCALLLCALLPLAFPGAARAEGQPLELRYPSFSGGGMEYTVTVPDGEIVEVNVYRQEKEEPGGGYEQVYVITGLKPGSTLGEVRAESPLSDYRYTALFRLTVDEELNVRREELPELTSLFFTRGGYLMPETWELGALGWSCVLGRDGRYVSVDFELLEEVRDLLFRHGVDGWDGFSESNPDVLDGEGFSLTLTLDDGSTVQASGENSFPPGYYEAVRELTARLSDAFAAAEAAEKGNRTPLAVDLYFPADSEGGWTWQSDNTQALQVETQYFGADSLLGKLAAEMGSPGVRWFHFRGAEPGSGSVELCLAPTDGEGQSLCRFVFRFLVEENLDIHIWGVEMYGALPASPGA